MDTWNDSWTDFLNLLEGQTVHLAAWKTHFAQDIILSGDIPIFVTSIEMVQFVGKRGKICAGGKCYHDWLMEGGEIHSSSYHRKTEKFRKLY